MKVNRKWKYISGKKNNNKKHKREQTQSSDMQICMERNTIIKVV